MARLLAGFCLLLGLTGSASAAKVTIRWHGQSFFEILSSKGTVIATDPHNLEAYGRREVNADVVLISHFHIDHTAPESIANWSKARKLLGLKKKDAKTDDFNEFEQTIKDVKISCVGAYHDNVQGMRRGKTGMFVIEVDGLRIAHLGDLGHTLSDSQLRKLGKIDILMIPVGGIYTINGSTAREVVDQIKPRRFILPMHYGTKVYDYVLDESQFLEDLPEKRVQRYKVNELVIESEEVPRKDPTFIVLGYDPK